MKKKWSGFSMKKKWSGFSDEEMERSVVRLRVVT
jgi:hypothetical protein